MQENEGKFSTGFLIGVLIGAAIVFLFGTKKGKKLLDIVSEEGLEGILDLGEDSEETQKLEDKIPKKIASSEKIEEVKAQQDIIRKPIRRFFRGAKPL